MLLFGPIYISQDMSLHEIAQFRMMHVHLPPLVTALAVINTAIAACKFGVCWRQDNRRRLQLAVFVAALVAAVATLEVAIIMNVFCVSTTDELGHEKLRKVFLCFVVLNCAILEAFHVCPSEINTKSCANI